jgi:hypothetical protein
MLPTIASSEAGWIADFSPRADALRRRDVDHVTLFSRAQCAGEMRRVYERLLCSDPSSE